MSVEYPIIDYIDGPNRIIYLKSPANWPISKITASGQLEWHPVDDLYKEVRTLRRTNEELQKYFSFVSALPLNDKGGGNTTSRGAKLLRGTRVVPFDATQTMRITGDLLSDEEVTGVDLINLDNLSNVKVKINYVPPPASEVIILDGNGQPADLTDTDKQWILDNATTDVTLRDLITIRNQIIGAQS